jgi:hypothetical protein
MKRRIVPVYGLAVHFTNDVDDARAFVKRRGGKDEAQAFDNVDGISLAFSTAHDERVRIIGVFDGTVATVTHESVHAAWEILETCGVQVSSDNDEALAFLAGWFTGQFMRCFPMKVS